MSKIKKFLSFVVLIIIGLLICIPAPVSAANCEISTKPRNITIPAGKQSLLGQEIEFEVKVNDPGTYEVILQEGIKILGIDTGVGYEGWSNTHPQSDNFLVTSDNQFLIKKITINNSSKSVFLEGRHQIIVKRNGVSTNYCSSIYSILKEGESKQVTCNLLGPKKPNASSEIKISGSISPIGTYRFVLPNQNRTSAPFTPDASGNISEQNLGQFNPGPNTIKLQRDVAQFINQTATVENFWEDTNCLIPSMNIPSTVDNPSPDLTPVAIGSGTPQGATGRVREPVSARGDRGKCGDIENPAINTAIGCIPTNPAEFINALIKFVLGISGGLAFLMMILGAFQMLASAGNPETLQAGRERFKSAIIGLLFVVFAILILQIIGVNILNIPGFK